MIGPQDGGGRGEEEEGAGPTVGVADDVRLRVRLPQDPVAPGWNVGPHLEDERRRRMKMKKRKMDERVGRTGGMEVDEGEEEEWRKRGGRG